jgi:hypothetical protein
MTEPTRVKHLSGVPLASPTNIRLGWKARHGQTVILKIRKMWTKIVLLHWTQVLKTGEAV